MAMQLAWYRTRREFTATYETALTRLFEHGRTETIRTLSADARAWVLAMADPQSSVRSSSALLPCIAALLTDPDLTFCLSVQNATRLELLRRAIQTHTALMRRASTGRGIDRHLLGLRLMLHAEEGKSHALFEDPFFAQSQMWKLSTSGLSAGEQFRGTGFGASCVDGYGINCECTSCVDCYSCSCLSSCQICLLLTGSGLALSPNTLVPRQALSCSRLLSLVHCLT